jgi:acetyl-CoA carboxylase biotin carboxylase subunit
MYEGWTVPIDYDPLLAKLIGYGTDRAQATSRLVRALNEYFVGGIKTNISLFRRILSDPDFAAGRLDTGYLDRLLAHPSEDTAADAPTAEVAAIAAGVFAVLDPVTAARGDETPTNGTGAEPASNWKRTARQEGLN